MERGKNAQTEVNHLSPPVGAASGLEQEEKELDGTAPTDMTPLLDLLSCLVVFRRAAVLYDSTIVLQAAARRRRKATAAAAGDDRTPFRNRATRTSRTRIVVGRAASVHTGVVPASALENTAGNIQVQAGAVHRPRRRRQQRLGFRWSLVLVMLVLPTV